MPEGLTIALHRQVFTVFKETLFYKLDQDCIIVPVNV